MQAVWTRKRLEKNNSKYLDVWLSRNFNMKKKKKLDKVCVMAAGAAAPP